MSLASSMDIQVAYVKVLRAAEKASKQRRSLRQTTRYELAIACVIQLQLRGTVGDRVVSDVAKAVATVKGKLTSAITSGKYATTLTASLVAENAQVDMGTLEPIYNNEIIDAATYTIVISSPQPTPAQTQTLKPTPMPTPQPTLQPTPAPTPAPTTPAPSRGIMSTLSSSADDGATTTTIIVVVVVAGGVLLVASGIALIMQQRTAQVMTEFTVFPRTIF